MDVAQHREDHPLNDLAYTLTAWPFSLSALASMLGETDAFAEFVRIVEEFLPEHQNYILGFHTMEQRVSSFATLFKERFFPLHWAFEENEVEEYDQVVASILVDPLGISYDFYTDISWFRSGCLLMISLIDTEDEGRIPILEECKKLVSADLLKNRPVLSFPEVEDILKGSRFEGVVNWARVWDHSSGYYFLDATYEDGYERIEWTMENVLALKRDWDGAMAYDRAIQDLATWIEQDMEAHFTEIIDFIREAQNEQRAKPVPVGRSRRPQPPVRPPGDSSGFLS